MSDRRTWTPLPSRLVVKRGTMPPHLNSCWVQIEEWTQGKEQNIRALLATMHEILWDGTTWKKLSLPDVCP